MKQRRPSRQSEVNRIWLGLWVISLGYVGCLTLNSPLVDPGWPAFVVGLVLALVSGSLFARGMWRLREAALDEALIELLKAMTEDMRREAVEMHDRHSPRP